MTGTNTRDSTFIQNESMCVFWCTVLHYRLQNHDNNVSTLENKSTKKKKLLHSCMETTNRELGTSSVEAFYKPSCNYKIMQRYLLIGGSF